MQSTGLAAFADPRILRPLDDLVENKTIDTANVPKSVVDTGRGFDGKLYMILTGVFSRVEFYNDVALNGPDCAAAANARGIEEAVRREALSFLGRLRQGAEPFLDTLVVDRWRFDRTTNEL